MDEILETLKSTLSCYKGSIVSINRRTEEIKSDIVDELSKQNNLEIAKTNIQNAIDNMRKCKQVSEINENSNSDTFSVNSEITVTSSIRTSASIRDETIIRTLNAAKYHYIHLCKLLKGYKLIVLNKFYNKFYIDNKFYEGLNEEEEIVNLANKFEINLKFIKLFICCKKYLN